MIVEDVTILHESCRPSPRDVKMLRFVGVEAITEVRERAKNECDRSDGDERATFGALQDGRLVRPEGFEPPTLRSEV